jgi:hypothetical protein
MSLQLNGDTGVTFNDASLQGAAASPYVLKNRIINGAMVIDQRNAGAAGSAATNTAPFGVDRWAVYGDVSGKFTYQQNAGAVTPPAGFTNYFGMTSTSAYTVLSGGRQLVVQSTEGFNTYDLDFGKATAKTITLSFWVYSSLTGTFGGSLQNYANTRSYPFTYTISVANTWEYKTVTIAGDTSGTWVGASNAGSFQLNFSLGSGSTYSGTAGAWATANYSSATGATSVVATNGATWYITGVQLEVGSTATPFERRLYGQELINCQRYYEKTYNTDVAPATVTGIGAISTVAYGAYSNRPFLGIQFKVSKRANPTVTLYSTSGVSGKIEGPSTVDYTAGTQYIGNQAFQVYQSQTTSTTNGDYYIHFTASAEL